MQRLLSIHCYIGGRGNPQAESYSGSKVDIVKKHGEFHFVEKDADAIKIAKWTEVDFVNWLLSGDIHLIICHPHQGCCNSWCAESLYLELDRLKDHNGFPSGKHLQCPIFSQNKIEYLHATWRMTNPTLKIIIQEDGDYSRCIRNIERYTS
jgi:hypothetical protein